VVAYERYHLHGGILKAQRHATLPQGVEMKTTIALTLLLVIIGCSKGGATKTNVATPEVIQVAAKASGTAQIEELYAKVASHAIVQYQIAKRNGLVMGACAEASRVSEAFLQANDRENHKAWEITEKADCKTAGAPNQY
jgi:hypothetical protein